MKDSSDEELVYAPAIAILANDLYPRKLEVVREYIQNASDALDIFRRIADQIEDSTAPQIKISIQGRSLLIWDNGIGMDGEEVQKLKRIAYSEKKEGEQAGHKGIGRLAGIAVAKKLLISSTSYGDPYLHKFEFRAKDLLDELQHNKSLGKTEPASLVIERHTSITSYEGYADEHYTMVELRDIDEKHPEVLDPARLREFIGEMAPVGFSPGFVYGERISEKLYEYIPDYSPKTIWLTSGNGDRAQVFKPYTSEMSVAEPKFFEIEDHGRTIAFCWCATKGKEMLGKVRPSGGKFSVAADTPDQKKRFAGLVYKLFGFSIGDRNLPLHTLWSKDYTRPLWFTGEIHIIDKRVKPTTDRSDFVDNDARAKLYESGKRVAKKLNGLAQDISDNRQAFDVARKFQDRFRDLQEHLDNSGIDRAEVAARREELHEAMATLKTRDCKDKDIELLVKQTTQQARSLEKRLDEASAKRGTTDDINDLAQELNMTSRARAVYKIIMATLEHYFRSDKDAYYQVADAIRQALKKKY